MIRTIVAVLSGLVTWFVVATLINFLIRAMVAGYAAAEPTMAFTLQMMIARLSAGWCPHWPPGSRVRWWRVAMVLPSTSSARFSFCCFCRCISSYGTFSPCGITLSS